MLETLAALTAALAIGAGAFGAHGAEGQAAEWLKTGGSYQLIHALAVLMLAKQAPGPAWTLLAGATVFALTLYAMAIGAPRWLGAVTPLGGLLMIAGWLWLAWQFARR